MRLEKLDVREELLERGWLVDFVEDLWTGRIPEGGCEGTEVTELGAWVWAWPLREFAITNMVLCMAHIWGVGGASYIAQ